MMKSSMTQMKNCFKGENIFRVKSDIHNSNIILEDIVPIPFYGCTLACLFMNMLPILQNESFFILKSSFIRNAF